MMLVTTSRKPGQLTRAMARTVADALGAAYLNRGKAGVDAVMAQAEKAGAKRVLFIWERKGNPSRMVVFDLEKAAQNADTQEKAGEGRQRTVQSGQKHPENQENEETAEKEKNKKIKESDGENEPGSQGEEKTDENDRNGDESQENDPENESEGHDGQKEEESGWLLPEVGIRGAVYHRRPIRHKGATIQTQDAFGEAVASLLHSQKGPNQIVLSRFGLKVIVDSELVLELKFRV